jgi:hypothetical protein
MPEERAQTSRPRLLKPAFALIIAGLPGILSLLLALSPIPGVPRTALLINPFLLLVVFAFVGAFFAPRCGLRSRIAERVSGYSTSIVPPHAGMTLVIGLALGIVITLADHSVAPLWQLRPSIPPSLVQGWSPVATLFGVLYGGIVEEVVMRWGVMSLVIWLLWRGAFRRYTMPPPAAIWCGIAVAAGLFAAGHLPALMASGLDLSGALIVRTISFDMIAGLIFGWLFARRHLESAIIAHAGFHLGVLCAALPFRLFAQTAG